jgi:demethylmenaquinone methyltransferase/2-methoxy-6-polyprenyl-1,4-benzoquinol methylase
MREELLAKRADDIRGMFARIAHRYDLLNRLLSLGSDVRWRRLLAERVAAAAPSRVLDVCTGTGDVALAVAGGHRTVGCDFCLPMLAHARPKIARAGADVALAAGDALALPFDDGAFGAVTVAFGVRNFEHLDRGLDELVRVTAGGGIVLVLEFSRPGGPFGPVLRGWTRIVPPLVGRLVSGDGAAYGYLPASVERFPAGAAMSARLEAAGLERVRATRLTGGVATLYEGVRPSRRDRDRRRG